MSRLERARERALERQRTLFGTRPSKRPTRPSRGPSRDYSRNQLSGGECQALKTENRLLKQKLIQQSEEVDKPTTAIDVLKQLQDALQDKMVYTLCAKFPHGPVMYCVLD